MNCDAIDAERTSFTKEEKMNSLQCTTSTPTTDFPSSTTVVASCVDSDAKPPTEAQPTPPQEFTTNAPDGNGDETASATDAKAEVTPPRASTCPGLTAEQVVALLVNPQLLQDPVGDAHITLRVEGRHQTLPVAGQRLRNILSRTAYEKFGRLPKENVIDDALRILGMYSASSPVTEIFVRVGYNERAIYLDLGTPTGEVIEVSPDGWVPLAEAPVAFLRPSGMLPLAMPQRGGSLDLLRSVANLADDDALTMVAGVLVGWLFAWIPQPILVVDGEHGSCKTTTCRNLRSIIDPHAAPLRSPPNSIRDLMIGARSNWVYGFDNLSTIQPWLSDALCRVASGGSFSTRLLYTDCDEQTIALRRPIIANGIEDVVTRDDLRDRCVFITCPPLPSNKRMPEQHVDQQMKTVAPYILGALLDAASMSLRLMNQTVLTPTPRLADFAKMIVAAEPALPWKPGHFLAAYERNRSNAVQTSLEGNSVAQALATLLDVHGGRWTGTATLLHHQLGNYVPEGVRRTSEWPANARWLSSRLKRLAPQLRSAQGVQIESQHGQQRTLTITRSSFPHGGGACT